MLGTHSRGKGDGVAQTTRSTPAVPESVTRNAWATLAIASAAAFMVALEITVISLALPDIQDAFANTSTSTLSWIFSAYSIGVATLLLVAGWASDLFGRKRLFLIGMSVFAMGSLLSGASQSIGMLIASRALQSVGGAMLFPSGLALVLAIFPPARRQMAIGIWAAMGGFAGSFGPSVGALLIQWLGWRAVFLINVPVAVLVVPIGMRVLVESRAEGANRNVDVIGAPLASLGVGALVLGISQGRDWGWGSPTIVASLVLAVVFTVAFVLRARRHPAPLFDLGLLRVPSYRVGILGSLLFSAGFFGSWVLLPTFIQRWWDWSVIKTGLALMPSSLISAVLSGPIGSRVDRFGHRRVVSIGAVLAASGMGCFALLMRTEVTVWALIAGNVLLGLGMAVLFAMIVGAAMRDVPMHRYGMAGAGRTTAFQLAQALGVAVGVAVIGQPQSASAALRSYRANWTISAVLLVAIAALFLTSYPERTD